MKKQGNVIDFQEARRSREKQGKGPKPRKRRRTVFLVTGLTRREFEAEPRRKRDLPPLRCYLCRREEGENSVVFREDGEARIGKPSFSCHRVKVDEDMEFGFLLCSECRILLGHLKKGKIIEE